jgi:8-oxo-dGTP diphosphatase
MPNEKSPLTTLCYIENENKYLMLHRISKKNDVNKDKWIGIGGHFEQNESPEECLLREVKEETGLTLNSYRFRGILTFICDNWQTEYICLYTSNDFTGELIACNEGTLEWVDKDKLNTLNLWEGDELFLNLLVTDEPFFSMKLIYQGNQLVGAWKNGEKIK